MSNKGYKVKVTGSPHKYKLPFFCPHCRQATGTIDDIYLRVVGICSTCVVMHVEDRPKPVIDLSEYAPAGGMFEGMSAAEIDSYFSNQEKEG